MDRHNAVRISHHAGRFTLCILFCFLLPASYFLLYMISFLFPTSPFLLHADPPDTLWARTYGGADVDVAYSVCQTSDGGYIATGYTSSFGVGQQDAYLVRLNSNGDTVWTTTFGGASMDGAHFVRETADHGYVIAAYTESFGGGGKNMYLIKTDTTGYPEYTRTYVTPLMDVAYACCETPDSGYMFVGYRDGPSGWVKGDLWILKTDATLDTLWTKEYGGAGEDYGTSIHPTPDGGYIITGTTSSFGAGGKDVWLVKIDALGDTMWTKTHGGALEDVGYGVDLTADNGYIVSGYINGTGAWTAGDVLLLKTDSLGNTLWTKIYGGSSPEYGFDIYQTPDHGYITAGQGSSDIWLLRTDSLGDTLWTVKYGGAGTESALALGTTSDGGYIIGGYTTSFGNGSNDFWIIKTGPETGIEELRPDATPSSSLQTVICGQLLLPFLKEHTIYDISGRRVTPTNLAPGIYFVESQGRIVTKIIKVR